MNTTNSKERNLKTALQLLHNAVAKQAKFIILPETFNYRGPDEEIRNQAETVSGPTMQVLKRFARQHAVWILGGSIFETTGVGKKVYNTSVIIKPNGIIQALYRKIHLFGVRWGTMNIQESTSVIAGRKPSLVNVMGERVGLSICYDLRFPELYRYYSNQGARILCVPASFTYKTGKDHWEILLKARAIENQCYVLAANRCGVDSNGSRAYGHSMIVDPWGKVVVRAGGDTSRVIVADLDMSLVLEVRHRLPALRHRVL